MLNFVIVDSYFEIMGTNGYHGDVDFCCLEKKVHGKKKIILGFICFIFV
jgi:hypothetical protein